MSNTVGRVDPASGLMSLTITMRAKFTGGSPSLGGACRTSSFSVTVATNKSTTSPAYNGLSYNTTSGTFQAVAQDFATGTVVAGDCNGASNATALNNFLGGGFSPALLLNGDTTSVLTGSQ